MNDLEYNNINTPEAKAERQKEKEEESAKLNAKKEQAIKNIRDEYMNKIKGARSE
jgi:hypothetical protein